MERARAWEWVKDPPAGEGQVGHRVKKLDKNMVSEKLNGITFGDYIEDIFTRLMEGEQDFMFLIPCNFNSNKKVNVKAA